MTDLDIRKFLIDYKKANKGPEEIFPQLARSAVLYYVPSNDEEFKGFNILLKRKMEKKFL